MVKLYLRATDSLSFCEQLRRNCNHFANELCVCLVSYCCRCYRNCYVFAETQFPPRLDFFSSSRATKTWPGGKENSQLHQQASKCGQVRFYPHSWTARCHGVPCQETQAFLIKSSHLTFLEVAVRDFKCCLPHLIRH